MNVRRPRLRIVNIPATSGEALTARLIAESARAAGADVAGAEAAGRDAASIAAALEPGACDLFLPSAAAASAARDAVIAALARRGEVVAHGIALQPGRTAAVARIGNIPVIALPGAPDQALAAWWTLVLPVLDRLSGLAPRQPVTLPLAAQDCLERRHHRTRAARNRIEGRWLPLAVGDFSLDAIARADAWLAVSGGPRALPRARRSMPICCGTDMG